jgi:hypothetical protein
MASIPLITLWTQSGIHCDYIEKRLGEYLFLEKSDAAVSTADCNREDF